MLNFKDFFEGLMGDNNGRGSQKFWLPETPITNDNPKIEPVGKKKHLKGVHLNQGFRPMFPSPFKGITADKFGIRVKKIPKPKK